MLFHSSSQVVTTAYVPGHTARDMHPGAAGQSIPTLPFYAYHIFDRQLHQHIACPHHPGQHVLRLWSTHCTAAALSQQRRHHCDWRRRCASTLLLSDVRSKTVDGHISDARRKCLSISFRIHLYEIFLMVKQCKNHRHSLVFQISRCNNIEGV